jgi:hypothetical protein
MQRLDMFSEALATCVRRAIARASALGCTRLFGMPTRQ